MIYLSVVGPGQAGIPNGNPARRYGVRIFGSGHLDFPANAGDPTGLTITSDAGIYVEGDYNVGVAGFPKMPASFMGDCDQRAVGRVVGYREQQERLAEPPVARRCVADRGHEHDDLRRVHRRRRRHHRR